MFKPLFFSIFFLFHPVHVTFTSIDYFPESNSFKVFVRMYFDDFQRDCKLNGLDVQDNQFTTNNSSEKDVTEKYLNEVILIKVNEKQLSGKLQNLNLADNEITMNMTYDTGKKLNVLTVKNRILTGLYSDQTNMIIVKINDFEEGFKLTSDKIEQTFNFK